jgi:hypothetical protein
VYIHKAKVKCPPVHDHAGIRGELEVEPTTMKIAEQYRKRKY